nr:unnamed protein product [Digitaria exilis]
MWSRNAVNQSPPILLDHRLLFDRAIVIGLVCPDAAAAHQVFVRLVDFLERAGAYSRAARGRQQRLCHARPPHLYGKVCVHGERPRQVIVPRALLSVKLGVPRTLRSGGNTAAARHACNLGGDIRVKVERGLGRRISQPERAETTNKIIIPPTPTQPKPL